MKQSFESPESHRETALAAIASLRYSAARGDALAAAALVAIGNTAACHCDALASAPEGTPQRAAADAAASDADRWPVSVPAVEEKRQAALATVPAGLGSNLEARTSKGARARVFHFNSRTGFAHVVFRELQAKPIVDRQPLTPEGLAAWLAASVPLPPLTLETLPAWVDAGEAWAQAQCGGVLENFPWPKKLSEDATVRSSNAGVGMESATRYVIREWLKYGFTQLVRTG
jgi:hypothetical protein